MEEALLSLKQLDRSHIDHLMMRMRTVKALTVTEEEQVRSEIPSARPSVLYGIVLRKGGPAIQAVQKFLEEDAAPFLKNEIKSGKEAGLQETFEGILRAGCVPDLPPCFVPRPGPVQKVQEGLLEHMEGTHSAVLVHGPGGCGKTTLLIAALRNVFQLDAFGRVMWLHVGILKGDAALLEKLHNICHCLGGTQRSSLDEFPGVLDEMCDELARQMHQRPPLLVLDNVWNDDIFEYLGTRFPLLVSSRSIPTNRTFSLNVDLSAGFAADESSQLFSKALNLSVVVLPDAVHRLVDSCASLPLAVALTAQLVAKEKSDVAGACDRLICRIKDRKLHQLPSSTSYYCGDPDANHTLYSVVSLSLEALQRDQVAWFEAFSFFAAIEANTWVPEAVLESFWPVTDPSMVRDLVSEELVDKSLLLTHESEKLLFSVHSIVHAVLCEFLTAEKVVEKHRRLVEKYSNACGRRWGDLKDDGYALRNLCGHMRAAGLKADEAEALKDFRFVTRRLWAETGAAAVAEDAAAAGPEDPVLRSLAALLRDPRAEASTGRYRADLRQVCALLPVGHELRLWAEANGRERGVWQTAEEQGTAAARWEPVLHRDHQIVTALTVADHLHGVLVAVKRPRDGAVAEAVVLESDGLRALARFQLDSQVFESVAVVNGGRALLLATRKGELFACNLPDSLQELARLHRAAPQRATRPEKLSVHRVATEASILLLASRRQAFVTVSEGGRLALHNLEFQGDGSCSLQSSSDHMVQLDWMAGPLSDISQTETAIARCVLEKLGDWISGFEVPLLDEFSRLQASVECSKCDLAMSPCGNFVAVFRNKTTAVFQIQDTTLKLLYEAQRPRNINCVCFLTLPRQDDDSPQTLIAEAVGGCVVIHKVHKENDIVDKVEFWKDVSALTSDANVLFVYSDNTFSVWKVSLDSYRNIGLAPFKDGCALLCFAKFPIFVSGIDGSLAQLREADFEPLQQLCASDLRAEVLSNQRDLFLAEDIPSHGVKLTNLRTKFVELDGLIPKFNPLSVIHGLSTNADKLAVAGLVGDLHIFDVRANTKTTLSITKTCTAICLCFNDCLFVGFDNGCVSIQRSDSPELVQVSGPESYFVKYLIPIDARRELASVSLGRDGCKFRMWSNIESADGPKCRIDVSLSVQLPKMNVLPMSVTMFAETHAARPTVSPDGRYMAAILPSSAPPLCASVLVVIDLESGRCRKEVWLITSQSNVVLVEIGGFVWLLAICDRKVLRAKVDADGFFDGIEPSFTEAALLLDERLKLLTLCGQREMIVTSSDAVTIWKMGEAGQLEDGRLLIPKSVVTGEFVATHANDTTLVIVTQSEMSPKNFCNHFYILEKSNF